MNLDNIDKYQQNLEVGQKAIYDLFYEDYLSNNDIISKLTETDKTRIKLWIQEYAIPFYIHINDNDMVLKLKNFSEK